MTSHTANWLALHTWNRPRQSASGIHNSNAGGRVALLQQVKAELVQVFLRDKMNVLLLLFPFAIISKAHKWSAGVTFILSLLPLCSLAERLGMITEQLAMYTNDTLGGLLNATFGNATEVIIAAFAIQKGYLRVVQLTLLGSMISNLLLVMGSAFVAGGFYHPMQHFNQQGIQVNTGLLILSVIAIMLPTLLSSTAEAVKDSSAELALSRFESVLMLLCYGLFLVFQLVTHRHLYEPSNAGSRPPSVPPLPSGTSCTEDLEFPNTPQHSTAAAAANSSKQPPVELELTSGPLPNGFHHQELSSSRISPFVLRDSSPGNDRSGGAAATVSQIRESDGVFNGGAVAGDQRWQSSVDEDETARLVSGQPAVQVVEEEEEELVLSRLGCFMWLTLVTVAISVLSDYIMDAITEASVQLKIPMPFLTTIMVPIVGNAAEHASALIFAVKNRMEISLGVAVGSATQIGVLVVPFCVVLAWIMGRPLDLNFNEFEGLVLFVSVLLTALMVQDGTSNWLKGALMMITYIFVAAGFWVHKDVLLQLDQMGSS